MKKFMWLQTMTDGINQVYYQDCRTDMRAKKAVCISCATNLLVFDRVLDGRLLDDYTDMRLLGSMVFKPIISVNA